MILRNEINEKVIITNQIAKKWWETNTYAIVEDGLFWLDRKDSHSEVDAHVRHEKAVQKEQPQVTHVCKYCAEIALTYWALTQTWMCSHHFAVYVIECS